MTRPLPVGLRTAVHQSVVDATVAELDGKDIKALRTESDNIEKILDDVFKASGDDLDLTLDAVAKVEGFDGSVADRATKIVEMHSRLAGVEQLIAGLHQAEEVRGEIRGIREQAGREVLDRGQGNLPGRVRQAFMSDAFYASIEEHAGEPIGPNFTVLDAYKRSGGIMTLESSYDAQDYLAAVVTTSAGWDPFVQRQPGHTPSISRPLQVYQTLPMSGTDQHGIEYMVQSVRTATAVVEKAEGAESGEAAFEWTERTEPMREIPAHVPVTEIQLEDEPQVRAIIDMDLRLMVMQRLDGQLINGNGTTPNISSIRDTRSSVAALTQDWGVTGTTRNDQINDAKKHKTYLILNGRVMPNVYYLHHEIWDEISLAETTSAGYYLGSPAAEFAERLWGLPVVLTDHLSAATASNSVGGLLVDTMFTRLWVRRSIHSEIGLNGTDFTKRQLTIRAAIRACLQVRRPQAVLTFQMP